MNSREKQEKYVAEYKEVIKHLPEAQMQRLGHTLAHIIRHFMAEGAEARDLPIEMSKMGSVVLTFIQSKQYGTLTDAQCRAVDKILDGFEESIRYTLPVMHNSLNQAANQGLGFGVIGSAASIALHSTLDTLERVKNLNSTMRAAGTVIDKDVKQLLVDLRQAMALPMYVPINSPSANNEEIQQEIRTQLKKFNRILMVPAIICNLIATTILVLLAIAAWRNTESTIIAPIMITISAILSVPGIGKLIFRKKYKFLHRILRWVIVVVILFIGFAFTI